MLLEPCYVGMSKVTVTLIGGRVSDHIKPPVGSGLAQERFVLQLLARLTGCQLSAYARLEVRGTSQTMILI
jgi:hypothetical protein